MVLGDRIGSYRSKCIRRVQEQSNRDDEVLLVSQSAAQSREPSFMPRTYQERVVSFLQQASIYDVIERKLDAVAREQGGARSATAMRASLWNARTKEMIGRVRTEGVGALSRFANDVKLTLLLRCSICCFLHWLEHVPVDSYFYCTV